ncbi:MAG: hypothetical protein J6B68_01055 [Lachnospiraceae bacterium]|nr:hypothetical protein [Lachnospiraceae bacterium]
MESKEQLLSALQELKIDSRKKQKSGLPFIIASVFIWIAVLGVHLSTLPILTKNMLTFCCSAPLVPMAYFISKLIGVDFQNKDNPLTKLGILFAVNQMLYILIAMWVYAAVPEKMLMVYAMIFGAHLLPYGWLYQSKTYYVLSVVVPILVLYIGCNYPTVAVAVLMLFIEIVFCICLIIENLFLNKKQSY